MGLSTPSGPGGAEASAQEPSAEVEIPGHFLLSGCSALLGYCPVGPAVPVVFWL